MLLHRRPITLHGVRSKKSQLGRCEDMKATIVQIHSIYTEMEDSESIKEIVNQVAMQAATGITMAFKDTDVALWPATMLNHYENQRQINRGLVLEKLRFN